MLREEQHHDEDVKQLHNLGYAQELARRMSGFSNFASIAIQIGGIAPLAPSRRGDIARLGLKAMIGGALASYMLASVAGAFYSGTSMLGIK